MSPSSYLGLYSFPLDPTSAALLGGRPGPGQRGRQQGSGFRGPARILAGLSEYGGVSKHQGI